MKLQLLSIVIWMVTVWIKIKFLTNKVLKQITKKSLAVNSQGYSKLHQSLDEKVSKEIAFVLPAL